MNEILNTAETPPCFIHGVMPRFSSVLSLFDGMSCGQIALNRVGIEYDNYFYKSPNFSWEFLFYKWISPYDNVIDNYVTLKKYFSNDFEIVSTLIFKDKDLSYIIKQKKIIWRVLNKNDFNDNQIKDNFLKLIKINKQMWKNEGLFLDILWTDILFKPFSVHNIFTCDNKKIYIFDFWLLNKNANNYLFRFISYFFYYFQLFWIKVLFFLSDKFNNKR